jgi:hypothetical protein
MSNALEMLNNSTRELKSQIASFKEEFTSISGREDRIKSLETGLRESSARLSGFTKRIKNVEAEVGISTGELISMDMANIAMFRGVITDFFGKNQVNQYVPEGNEKDPAIIVQAMKKIIRKLSFMEHSDNPDITEILFKYSEISEKTDRRSLFLAFNSDVRRTCEAGLAVLMEIGQNKGRIRRIIEEVRKLAKQWIEEDDIKGESGILTALELLTILEKEIR